VYYGDEIGMGDNVYLGDRNGVRTPMQWSIDRNAGFSEADSAALYSPVIADPPYSYHTVNVAAQDRTPTSLLRWMRRLVGVRKQFRAFGRGTFEPLAPENRRVLVFLRRYRDEVILCVNNLSRFAQFVELDLREFTGCVPLELWGNVAFPPIGELPYLLTLGPHNFLWFRLLAADQIPRSS
jgi:maltose alpha-D-glucosyltransferase/alpha-amylase